MVPAKPFTAVKVIVELEVDPGATVLGEVALTRKSWNLNIAEAV